MNETPSICFVAHFAYGALSGRPDGHIGGAERQQAIMAKWLARRGYRVSMLTWDVGFVDGESYDGVRVYKIVRRNAGLPGLRFFHPRWTGLNGAMARADAGVYYQNVGECVTGQVALWCRRNDRRFIYSVASDPDVDPALPLMSARDRLFYRYGLRAADRVLVQTQFQQRRLLDGWRILSTIVPMPYRNLQDLSSTSSVPPPPNKGRILWVGRIDENKRLEWLLDVAAACPDVGFDVVGAPNAESEYSRGVVQRARSLPNVTYHGYVSYETCFHYYQNASMLCCTSGHEGFPNTFLEAWCHGMPIVSTFDPDRLIATRGLGVVAADVPGLVAGIRGLIDRPERWRDISANVRTYYLQNHDVSVVMPQFEDVFRRVVERTHEPTGGATIPI